MKLRPYQKKAVSKALDNLRAGRHTLLLGPTGAGKTLMSSEIAKHFSHVIDISPRRELVSQARKAMDWSVHCHTTQGASRKGVNKADFLPKTCDLLIIDEALQATTDSVAEIIKRYPNAVRLGTDAATRRLDGKGLDTVFDEMVEAATVQELIEARFLVPYKAFEAPDAALKELRTMKRSRGEFEQRELSALMSRPTLVSNAVREYKKHAMGRRAICFTVSVDHSQKLTKEFNDGGIRTVHLDGNTNYRIRAEALARLASGELDVICNVDLFTKGLDIPAISCVILERPTLSEALFLHMVGRGMRPDDASGKVDLVILDHAGLIERFGEPNEDREWTLKPPPREPRPGEPNYCPPWVRERGFESLEAYELEQSRIRSITVHFNYIRGKLGLGESATNLWIARNKLTRHSHGVYDKSETELALARYMSSYTKQELPNLFPGLTNCQITKLTRVNKVKRYEQSCYVKEDIDQLRDVFTTSVSRSEAMVMLGCNPGEFHALLRRLRPVKLMGISERYSKSEIESLCGVRAAYAYTFKELRHATGLSSGGATDWIKRNNIPRIAWGLYDKILVDASISSDRLQCNCRDVERALAPFGLGAGTARYVLRLLGANGHPKRIDRTSLEAVLETIRMSITVGEAIKLLGVSTSSWSRAIRREGLVACFGKQQTARYLKSDVDDLAVKLAANKAA